jgi:hypothetical protein
MVINYEQIQIPSFIVSNPVSTPNMNAATLRFAFGFYTLQAFNLSRVHVYVSGRAGTPNIGCNICQGSGVSGLPPSNPTPIASTTLSPPAGTATFQFASPVPLSANTMYWVYFSNLSGSPGTNWIAMHRSYGMWSTGSSLGPPSWCIASSSDSGATWSYILEHIPAVVLEANSGAQYGQLFGSGSSANLSAGSFIGYRFTAPVDMEFVSARIAWSGVSSTNIGTFRLEVLSADGSTVIWSGQNIAGYRSSGTGRISTYHSPDTYFIKKGTTCIAGIRAVSGTSTSDQILTRNLTLGTSRYGALSLESAYYDVGTSTWTFVASRYPSVVLGFNALSAPIEITPSVHRGVW